MSRTSRIPNEFASQGAVNQNGGTLPLYRCNACRAEVVWATSKRTGRKYLCGVRHGYLGQRYYVGADLHTNAICEARNADVEAAAASVVDVSMDRTSADTLRHIAAEVLRKSCKHSLTLHKAGTITDDQYLADLDLYEAEYNAAVAGL